MYRLLRVPALNNPRNIGLYLHIPYCSSKCYYCDFYSAAKDGVPQAYVDALVREMHLWSQKWQQSRLFPKTIYFGGGTPSLMTPQQVSQLIEQAQPSQEAEITLECNPEHITKSKLSDFYHAGVNRISFGFQTVYAESLKRLGRKHTLLQAQQALDFAHQVGFQNICGDMMLALPHYTTQELDDTLSFLSNGGCTHISAYLLKIEPNTVFGKKTPSNLPCDDESADSYLYAVKVLEQLGYHQYEVSNFCKPGFEAVHNTRYWTHQPYLGIGVSAASCIDNVRFFTPKGIADFLSKPAVYKQEDTFTWQDDIMLQLRLSKGISFSEMQNKWNLSFETKHFSFFQKLSAHGLAQFSQNHFSLTPQGFLLQNSILCELLDLF